MKRNILYALLAAMTSVTLFSCSEDSMEKESVIVDSNVSQNSFDKWLTSNFVTSYNVQFLYRYEDKESDMDFYNVPADYNQAVKLAHIVKYACIEAYDKVGGVTFTRKYFPKMLYATGEFEYMNNGTMILGTAEGGKKVFLCGTNHLDQLATSLENLNTFYLRTIHHEFGHILNQTKDFSEDFRKITGNLYISDAWSTDAGMTGYLQRGFITAYSQNTKDEDFVEILSMYITNPESEWNKMLSQAAVNSDGTPADGAKLISEKLEIVRSYMLNNFDIDIDELRDEVIRRENDVINGTVNLLDLNVE